MRVDPKSGVVKPLAKGGPLGIPHGIALEPGGPAYVTDFRSRSVAKVEQSGSSWSASVVKKGPFLGPEGIAVVPTGAGPGF